MAMLLASWRAHPKVFAATTTRSGGVSKAPYDSFNLSADVGDDAAAVESNRTRLSAQLGCTEDSICWLHQEHGKTVVEAGTDNLNVASDASWTQTPGQICVVQTADCLPVLFSDREGSWVAAAHAGWRGLLAGVLEETLALAPSGSEVLAWLGPAIGPRAFEVGPEVKTAFMAQKGQWGSAFLRSPREGFWLMDIYAIARQKLLAAGAAGVYGGEHCTYSDARRFYSYRRDGTTGRMASLIYLRPDSG